MQSQKYTNTETYKNIKDVETVAFRDKYTQKTAVTNTNMQTQTQKHENTGTTIQTQQHEVYTLGYKPCAWEHSAGLLTAFIMLGEKF